MLRYLPFSALAAIPLIGSFISIVDALLGFRQDRRRLHDHLAGTKVILVGE